jgi:hypothetical protein
MGVPPWVSHGAVTQEPKTLAKEAGAGHLSFRAARPARPGFRAWLAAGYQVQ